MVAIVINHLPMIAPNMMGEGRNTNKDKADTMMTKDAALSLGSTALRDTSWLPSLPVAPRREKTVRMPMMIENCLLQSKGQYPPTAPVGLVRTEVPLATGDFNSVSFHQGSATVKFSCSADSITQEQSE